MIVRHNIYHGIIHLAVEDEFDELNCSGHTSLQAKLGVPS